jgi:hypothetical protein
MLVSELFVSHAAADHAFVEPLVGTIRRHGLPVWYSKTNLVGAQQWHDEIGAALERCDWFLVVLSPNSVESIWVKRELLFALSEKRYTNRIIPLLYQPWEYKKLSWVLNNFQRVDFTNGEEEGYHALFQSWGLGYRPA